MEDILTEERTYLRLALTYKTNDSEQEAIGNILIMQIMLDIAVAKNYLNQMGPFTTRLRDLPMPIPNNEYHTSINKMTRLNHIKLIYYAYCGNELWIPAFDSIIDSAIQSEMNLLYFLTESSCLGCVNRGSYNLH